MPGHEAFTVRIDGDEIHLYFQSRADLLKALLDRKVLALPSHTTGKELEPDEMEDAVVEVAGTIAAVKACKLAKEVIATEAVMIEIVAPEAVIIDKKALAAATEISTLRVGAWELDRVDRRFRASDSETWVDLSKREFGLLKFLMVRAGTIVTRSECLKEVWRDRPGIECNVVDVYIKYLRTKFEGVTAGALCPIKTVRGKGYEFVIGPGVAVAI